MNITRIFVLGGIGCLVVSSGITMLVPYGLGRILDTIYAKDSSRAEAKENLKKFCFVLVGVFLVGGLANFGRVYLFNAACEYQQHNRCNIIANFYDSQHFV